MKITVCISEKTGELGAEVEVSSLSSLESLSRTGPWSPYLFKRIQQTQKSGKPYKLFRNKLNFYQADFFGIDIDQGMTLEEAVQIIKDNNFCAFINTSQSHRINGNGDRFRVVFQLAESITNPNLIKGTFEYLRIKYFPTMDEACKDEARFFKASKETVLINDGENTVKLSPVNLEPKGATDIQPQGSDNRLRLSLTTQLFLNTYQKEGERHAPLVKACKNAGQQGWSKEEFKASLRLDVNPWLNEEKHQNTIDDIFDNERWDNLAPFLYTEDQKQIAGAVQSKWTGIWLKNNKIKCTYDGMLLVEGKSVPASKITRDLRLEAARLNLNMNIKLFDDLIEEFVENSRHEFLDAVKRNLNIEADEKEGIEQLEHFLDLLCGEYKKPTDSYVMRHFIWNVKRRMNQQESYREVMPILKGVDHGTGKSYNLKNNFLGPISALKKEADFKQLEDSREWKLLTDNFVLVFDEMAHVSMSNLDNIKRLITESNVTVRRMRETTHEYLPKNAQFIGTSNRDITNLLQDHTGMRRFYEISCRSRESITESLTEYYEKFNHIDYLKIWRSVDPTKKTPLMQVITEMEIIQNEYKTNHPIDDWIEDSGEVEIVENLWTNATLLINNYNSYQIIHSYQASPKKFSNYLKESKYCNKIKKRRLSSGVEYNLKLKNNKHIGEY